MQLFKAQSSMRLAATRAPRPQPRTVVFSSDRQDVPSPSPMGGQTSTEAEFKAAAEKLAFPQAPVMAAAAAAPSFNDVMGFSGSVPEIVNGRLAMLGFVAAVAAELSSGQSVLRQLADEPTGIVAVFALIIAGSLVPASKSNAVQQLGPLTPTAELINGRSAMIGFAFMLIFEIVTRHALF